MAGKAQTTTAQVETETPATDDIRRLEKTTSAKMMSDHAVEEHMLQELWFGRFIARCPCLLCVLIVFFLSIVMAIVSSYEGGLLSDDTYRDLWPEGNADIDAYDAYVLATEAGDNNISVNEPQTQRMDGWTYLFYFTLADYADDISADTDYFLMTRANIDTMMQFEDRVVRDEDWKRRFCFVGENPTSVNYSCDAAIQSPARLVYDQPGYDNWTDADIRQFFIDNQQYAFYFNAEFAELNQTYLARSFFYAGGPVATWWSTEGGVTVKNSTYLNPSDDAAGQMDEYATWAYPLFEELMVEPNGDLLSDDGELNVMVFTGPAVGKAFDDVLTEAFTFMGLAVMAVLVYMTIHLGSIFLACGALFQILMSFPLAMMFYRSIFQITYLGFLNYLIIFVLLGVGADDVFVFTDAWKQSKIFVNVDATTKQESKCCVASDEEVNILRMSFSFRRAAKAMLVTQITTFIAFLATASAPLMPLQAFGYWAALIVGMNYVLVITLYPAILMLHHRFIKKYEDACLCFLCNLRSTNKSETSEAVHPGTASADVLDATPSLTRQISAEEAAEEYGCFERFLARTWTTRINRYKYFVLAFFLVLLTIAAIFGFQIEPEDDTEQWFYGDHWFNKYVDTSDNFPSSDIDGVDILITFGIDGVDRDDAPMWDSASYGTVVWDDSFSMSSAESQEYLLTLCEELRASDMVYSNDTVICPITEFKSYAEAMSLSFPYVPASDDSSDSFASVYHAYLNSDYASSDTQSKSLSGTAREDNGEYVVRYYAMSALVGEINAGSGTADIEEVKDDWDAWRDDAASGCPAQLCDSLTQFSLAYCTVALREGFVTSAVQGIGIALPIALVVMLFSTRNWVVSVFAIMDIIGVMLCELAIMQLAGWKLGISECVAVVIIIGFSVDYVVHLANAYLESLASERIPRLSFSLMTMGISVVSGAITTFGAGFFLIFPEVLLFYKMGIIMMTTVFMSLLWGMCFFTSMLAAIGPQGDTGDLSKYCTAFACCKQEEAEQDQKKVSLSPKAVELQVQTNQAES